MSNLFLSMWFEWVSECMCARAYVDIANVWQNHRQSKQWESTHATKSHKYFIKFTHNTYAIDCSTIGSLFLYTDLEVSLSEYGTQGWHYVRNGQSILRILRFTFARFAFWKVFCYFKRFQCKESKRHRMATTFFLKAKNHVSADGITGEHGKLM